MPGILPMKVIKVGTSAQARIAQACDRCRSKKIRCDGVRPCCTQCANVGFECKTSDKLSRRAFPRGYTESLEERVRSLETEVRELKELLDEKDEKIDMLTKIHPQNSPSYSLSPRRSSATPPTGPSSVSSEPPLPKEDSFKVQQSPYLLEDSSTESYFVGTSSGKTFIDAFKHRVQEKGRSAADIKPELLLSTAAKQQARPQRVLQPSDWKAAPRLVSDQMINVFFQEWAPLFPILHRPTFLGLYAEYTADPDAVTDKAKLAQLNLVFGLAAISHGSQQVTDIDSFESQWQAALASIQTEQNMATLQCLLLAQLYCIQRGDYSKLLTYKALAISLSSRLGLHQSQKRFALGTLTCETRKKVFWTLYTIDSFSAVLLGLPKQLKDDDVHCELPVDADDEYVSERGFQPLLPGESTRLSSALALFRVTRILSKVLEEVYPALPSYELSLQKLSSLSEELDQWLSSLAPHLRLPFAQDRPTVGTVSSRSPLLSLTYHYVRALIHRPAVCASLGSRSSSSAMAMASSCKHIIQIVELLAERGLSFSFCLNKEEVLVLSGFGLLYQGLDLDRDSKVLKDNHKSLAAAIKLLDKSQAHHAAEFRRVACSFLPTAICSEAEKFSQSANSQSRHSSEGTRPAASQPTASSSLKQQFKAMTAKLMAPPRSALKEQRRATEPRITYHTNHVAQSQPALFTYDPSHVTRSEPAGSPPVKTTGQTASSRPSGPPNAKPRSASGTDQRLNLDYLSFGDDTVQKFNLPFVKPEPSDWERLLGNLDNGQTNIFDSVYGGPPVDMLQDKGSRQSALSHSTSDLTDDGMGWGPDIWTLTSADLAPVHPAPTVSESVLSFSTDDGFGSNSGRELQDDACGSSDAFRAIVMPHDLGGNDDGLLNLGWESSLTL